jgi:hypothetical protein
LALYDTWRNNASAVRVADCSLSSISSTSRSKPSIWTDRYSAHLHSSLYRWLDCDTIDRGSASLGGDRSSPKADVERTRSGLVMRGAVALRETPWPHRSNAYGWHLSRRRLSSVEDKPARAPKPNLSSAATIALRGTMLSSASKIHETVTIGGPILRDCRATAGFDVRTDAPRLSARTIDMASRTERQRSFRTRSCPTEWCSWRHWSPCCPALPG